MEQLSLEFGEDELQPQKRLFSFLVPSKTIPIPEDSERKPFPYKDAGIFSKLYFLWLLPVMKVGYRRTLTKRDLFHLTDNLKVETSLEKFKVVYNSKLEFYKNLHINTKLEARGETPETSSVSRNDDLRDFKLSKYNMIWILILAFKKYIIIYQSLAVFALIIVACVPLLIKELIKFVQLRTFGISTSIGTGIGYSVGVCIMMLVQSLAFNHFFFLGNILGIQVKSVLTSMLLQKSFKLTPESRHRFPVSKITSMMATDLSRIELAVLLQPVILGIVPPIFIAIAILIINIGVSAILGILVFLVFLTLIGLAVAELFRQREVVSTLTDKRVGIIKEIINNLKMIKFYSWELPYLKSVMVARSKETNVIMKIQAIRNVVTSVAMCLTGITSMISFLILYALEHGTRTAADIFSSVSAFEILSLFMTFVPLCLSTTADLLQGLDRIGDFLSTPDENEYERYHLNESPAYSFDNSVVLTDACFVWDEFDELEDPLVEKKNQKKAKKEEKKRLKKERRANMKKVFLSKDQINTEIELERMDLKQDIKDNDESDTSNFAGLQNINLEVKKGEFMVVTGAIGSGKSSLLNAISGFMKCTSGTIDINGSLLFCGTPWVQNATIRENIVFGLEFDQKRYDEIIYSCSLQNDLKVLPGGDLTEVGEKGITLSGGQKARISLARAVYANREVVLLDDVLSAVDARVGKHIIDHCLLDLLAKKTRILATHQLSLIGSADRVVFLKGDGSIQVGTMKELKLQSEDFRKLMTFIEQCEQEDKKEEKDEEEIEDYIGDDCASTGSLEFENIDEASVHSKIQTIRKRNTKSGMQIDDEAVYHDIYLDKDASKGRIIEKEEVAVNQIDKDIYYNYVKYGAGKLTWFGFAVIFVSLMAISTFCELFTNTWLSFWISQKFEDRSNGFYIGIYVMINLLWVLFLTALYHTLTTMMIGSSKHLHLAAVKRVLYTPMSYIDITPIGRILNRFTKDTDALDNEISEQAIVLTDSFARIIGVFILCIIYIPWIAICLPIILITLVALANFYQASNREVKRLEATRRSYVYSNFNESLTGLNTIKAYKQNDRFYERNNHFLNKMNEASFLVFANQRWLELMLDILSTFYILVVALLCVNQVFRLNPASVGLLLSYSFLVGQSLTEVIKTYTQFENAMNSAERIIHYALKLPQEAPPVVESSQPAEWPVAGEIQFNDVSMVYRPGLPLVLKNISFKVNGGEKIGICGRTGAGKSSIMTALYRLSELDHGSISIDGVDIATLGLQTLRSGLSIIPQDPVLFAGTIRKNLDPFGENDDDKLWDALRRSHLIDLDELDEVKLQVKLPESTIHKFHLDQIVEDEGVNFSLGERQLIAFARALVRNTKILVLDEATSLVDYETDSKIQTTIAEEFRHCTILCIAHRLKTIIKYDRIMTLERGKIAEFDVPKNLFKDEHGIFRQMCDKSNITIEDF
jgi:ABC-type multidrug transport system fused ATPase/permease subunit